jgi:soluble lytic murein transglycosylase-like protein
MLEAVRRRLALAAAVLGAVAVAAIGLVALFGGGEDSPVDVPAAYVPTPPGTDAERVPDPFAYDPERREEFERRAAAGNAHVLYARSPGGAAATAERTAKWRSLVERGAERAGVDPDMLEALVFLESAGREDAITPLGVEGAAGLTQIVAGTATTLLGMELDLARSRSYTRRIQRALRRGDLFRVQRLRAARRRVDPRFDPARAMAGTVKYLRLALERFDSEELAFVSYHMGMGNLENVLSAYAGDEADPHDVPYAQVYFDTSPLRKPAAHDALRSLGDDSSNYLWKLHAAREIMRLHRTDPEELAAMEELQTAKNSAEEVLHPDGSVPVFATPGDVRTAYDEGDLVPVPVDTARTGLRIDTRMGELAAEKSLYRGLRPEAMALALYIGAQVRAMSGDERSALTMTSTVRDTEYQRRLIRRNDEATRNYSLHTTGWAFDVARRYRSREQALAFQFVLDRLQALNVIAWVREPGAIHITAGREAGALRELLESSGG